MKLMHIADLHLDSAFSGFDKVEGDRRRAELRECFKRAMRLAKDEGVDLVLIPGDLFDTPFCTASTRRAVFDAIRDLGSPVVIAPGNHDHYNKGGAYSDALLPENALVFTSDELGRFDLDELGVSVIGYAFTSDRYESDPLASEIPLSSENVNILCAHADLGSPFSKYAPMSASAIARAGFVYAALGHVHARREPVTAGNSLIAYSGFCQGRSFDELGEGGGYIVDIDIEKRRVTSIKRVVLSTLSYRIERVDCAGAESDRDVEERIAQVVASRGYGKDTALRAVLVGSVPSTYEPSARSICSSSVADGLALLRIRNELCAAADLASLEGDLTVRGEVYRALLPKLSSEDGEERARASLALKLALAALDRREIGVGEEGDEGQI